MPPLLQTLPEVVSTIIAEGATFANRDDRLIARSRPAWSGEVGPTSMTLIDTGMVLPLTLPAYVRQAWPIASRSSIGIGKVASGRASRSTMQRTPNEYPSDRVRTISQSW